jgi:hypothetical protein
LKFPQVFFGGAIIQIIYLKNIIAITSISVPKKTCNWSVKMSYFPPFKPGECAIFGNKNRPPEMEDG